MKKIVEAVAGEDLQPGQVVVSDFTRLEEKAARLVAGYRGGNSALAAYQEAAIWGTSLHKIAFGQMARDDGPPPARQKPWKKGFIPTVGKKPDLPAPVIPGWELATRTDNVVTYYETDKAPNWMFAGATSIVGNLVKRQWAVMRVAHDVHDSFSTAPVFTASNPDACLLFLALEDKPPDILEQLKAYSAADVDHQLDTYRNLFTNTGRYRKP